MIEIKNIKQTGFYLTGLTLLALGLRLFRLGFRSLWLDEAYSLKLASADWQGIVQGAAMDIHPPLFHILLGGWIRVFGTSEYALRSLSALMGALLIPVIFKLVAVMINRRAAWFTAGLTAVSPYFLELSRSGRMAGLLALLVVLAWYFFWRFLNDDRIWSIVGYGAAILAALYTHYFGFLVLFSQHLYIFMGIGKLKLSREKRKAWMLIQMFLLLGYSPWLTIFWKHLSSGGPSWRGVGASWFEPLHSLYSFMVGISCWTLADKLSAGSLLLVAAIPAGAYLIPRWRDWYGVMLPRAWGLILTGIFVPLGLVWVYSINKINVFDNRYLSFPAAACLLLLGTALAALPRRKSIIVGGLILAGFAIPIGNQFFVYRYYDNWRGVAAIIEKQVRKNDTVAVYPAWNENPLDYYLRDDVPIQGIPGTYDPISGVTKDYFYINRENIDNLKSLFTSEQQVWLVLVNQGQPQELIHEWFLAGFKPKYEQQSEGIRIILFEPKVL